MLHLGYLVMLMREGASVLGRVCLALSAYIRWELRKGNGDKAHNGLLAYFFQPPACDKKVQKSTQKRSEDAVNDRQD